MYYLVSQETTGGDQWLDNDSVFTTTSDITISSAIYNSGSGWTLTGGAGNSYGPVSMRYAVVASETLVTGQTLSSTIRSNFTGWVGFQFTVGPKPMVVTELGRWIVSGNSQTHTIKIVDNSGNDVSGASVSLSTSGKTAGAFAYVALSTPVVLAANTTYCLLTHETMGGDQWYNYDCVLGTTSAATINQGAFYYDNSTVFSGGGSTGNSFGPVSLKYAGQIPVEYSYLGLDRRVIARYLSQPDVELTYYTASGSGDAGDHRFGSVWAGDRPEVAGITSVQWEEDFTLDPNWQLEQLHHKGFRKHYPQSFT